MDSIADTSAVSQASKYAIWNAYRVSYWNDKKYNPVECTYCFFLILNKILKIRVSEGIDGNRFVIQAGEG